METFAYEQTLKVSLARCFTVAGEKRFPESDSFLKQKPPFPFSVSTRSFDFLSHFERCHNIMALRAEARAQDP